ncbi:sensor domain-containing diguanylate cyclase [Nitrincola iocasae]|uniref:diguanylate cyclase n=1 Tax=Nitrincola iocasae TaxID=2614693 RepID=A0A5J6LEV6_9GAMM|nr:diguanylate cyclase [Nitrincola iocasae]QEW06948.1 diguanylate cyclase [Nitrincola iocasae]
MTPQTPRNELHTLHWQMSLLDNLDVGLMVLDSDLKVALWNNFMVNHSGLPSSQVQGQSLFSVFPELDTLWFKRKLNSVLTLDNPAFMTWEERPWLFRFNSYRPITGSTRWMYQNVTLIPLTSPDGKIKQIGLIIYDVTDEAVSRQALEKANLELSKLSRTDHLTGLNNRGYWETCLQQEFERFIRTQQPTSLILLDIDHFKQVNDTQGHLAGDAVIRQLADIIRQMIRTTDIAGRYGGEEFGILLLNTPAVNAEILAERLRYAVETRPIAYEGEQLMVTISLGVAAADNSFQDYQSWLEKADQCLYQAKESGRNQFVTL